MLQGLSPSLATESYSAFHLATRWRQQVLAHRQQCIHGDHRMDDLGLRVVEGDDVPPMLTQIFHK